MGSIGIVGPFCLWVSWVREYMHLFRVFFLRLQEGLFLMFKTRCFSLVVHVAELTYHQVALHHEGELHDRR